MSTATGAPDIRHAKAWLQDAVAQLHDKAREHNDDALNNLAATISDVANRAPLPVDGGAIVVMDASAIIAYHEAVSLISNAQRWSDGADLSYDVISADEGEAGVRIVNRRREQVAEMERSLYRSITHLCTVAQNHDGPCHVFRDSEGSFYWRHTQSGYHGGVIYHAHYADKGRERLPVGTWSIHT